MNKSAKERKSKGSKESQKEDKDFFCVEKINEKGSMPCQGG